VTVRIVDASRLPKSALGPRAPMWWGAVLLLAIETTTFAIMAASYFYVRATFLPWPPSPLPLVRWGALPLLPLALSAVPALLARSAAVAGDLRRMRVYMVMTTVFGLLFLAARAEEFARLPLRWDGNAYGSLVWTTLGLHTVDAVASVVENCFVSVILFRTPVEEKRRLDTAVAAWGWLALALVWLPFFSLFYLEALL